MRRAEHPSTAENWSGNRPEVVHRARNRQIVLPRHSPHPTPVAVGSVRRGRGRRPGLGTLRPEPRRSRGDGVLELAGPLREKHSSVQPYRPWRCPHGGLYPLGFVSLSERRLHLGEGSLTASRTTPNVQSSSFQSPYCVGNEPAEPHRALKHHRPQLGQRVRRHALAWVAVGSGSRGLGGGGGSVMRPPERSRSYIAGREVHAGANPRTQPSKIPDSGLDVSPHSRSQGPQASAPTSPWASFPRQVQRSSSPRPGSGRGPSMTTTRICGLCSRLRTSRRCPAPCGADPPPRRGATSDGRRARPSAADHGDAGPQPRRVVVNVEVSVGDDGLELHMGTLRSRSASARVLGQERLPFLCELLGSPTAAWTRVIPIALRLLSRDARRQPCDPSRRTPVRTRRACPLSPTV